MLIKGFFFKILFLIVLLITPRVFGCFICPKVFAFQDFESKSN